MRKHCVAFLLLCPSAFAQQPVTYSGEVPASSREFGGYRISNSFEFGYRFANVGGDHDLYRASVNFGDGLRLFQGRLRLNSLDGRGRALDEFRLRSSGAAGDPYQAQVMRVEKNGLYRYDLQYRKVRYHNRLPSLWRGEHGLTVERGMQTHEVTVFPGSNFEVLLGYDRNGRSGPGFSSVGTTDNFGLLDARNYLRYQTDLRQSNRQYRAGFTAKFIGLALTATHAIDLYEEEGSQVDASGLPSATSNIQLVEDFTRSQPFRGRTPITTLALRTRKDRVIGFNSRFVYAGGTRNSALKDHISVPGSATRRAGYREAFIVGDASRKQSSGEATIVLLPTPRWTITNTTAFHNTRIDGDASLVEIGFFRNEYLRFSHLGIRRISNASEANYRALKEVSLYGAYRFSTRRARSSDALRYPDFGFGRELAAVDNKFHSGGAGVRWLPGRNLRASFDFEVGRADRPLTPTSERRFHNQSARFRWRARDVTVSAYFKNRVNDNPTELVAYSSKSRSQGVHASWLHPKTGMVLDAGYSLLNMEVSTGILDLFEFSGEPERLRSIYASSIHNLNFAIRATPAQRVTLRLGYNLTKDTGGGDFDLAFAERSAFSLEDAYLMTSLPMSYHSPRVRLSVAMKANLAWNFGWQYYGYSERISGIRGFRSHIGYTSLTVGF